MTKRNVSPLWAVVALVVIVGVCGYQYVESDPARRSDAAREAFATRGEFNIDAALFKAHVFAVIALALCSMSVLIQFKFTRNWLLNWRPSTQLETLNNAAS